MRPESSSRSDSFKTGSQPNWTWQLENRSYILVPDPLPHCGETGPVFYMIGDTMKRVTRFISNANRTVLKGSKRFAIAMLVICALFGIVSGSVLLFAPERLNEVQNSLVALGSRGYKLPDVSAVPHSSEQEIRTLKTFSKVFVNLAKQSRPALVLLRRLDKCRVAVAEAFLFPMTFSFHFFHREADNVSADFSNSNLLAQDSLSTSKTAM